MSTPQALVDEIVDEELRPHVPGAAVAVLRDGMTIAESTVGYADLGWRQPVSASTLFHIGSISKPMTAWAVRGTGVHLDAPITEYLKGYPNGRPTVRHLLTHTSGIVNFVRMPGFFESMGRIDHSDEELVEIFAHEPLLFEPGSRYSYSNSGYRLLDMIVKAVTGEEIDAVLRRSVFEPFGMDTAVLLDDKAIVYEMAAGYAPGPVRAPYISATKFGGAGGVAASLRDMEAFDRATRRERAAAEKNRLNSGRLEGYGLGWVIGEYRGRRHVGHHGGVPGFSTGYVTLPDQGLSVIVLTNLAGFSCNAAIRRIVDALEPAHPSTPQWMDGGRERGGGVYEEPLNTLEIQRDGDRLVVGDYRLRGTSEGVYVDESDADVVLRFHDEDGACTLSYPFTWVTGYDVRRNSASQLVSQVSPPSVEKA